jgi:hypothetical protein
MAPATLEVFLVLFQCPVCSDGDHDESDCMKRGWNETLVHHTIVDAWVRMLKRCGGVVEGSI